MVSVGRALSYSHSESHTLGERPCIMTGESGSVIDRQTGNVIDEYREPLINPGLPAKLFIFVAFFIFIYLGSRSVATRRKQFIVDHIQHLASRFNNRAKEVFSSKTQLIFLILFGLLITAPSTIIFFIDFGQTLSNEVTVAVNISRQTISQIVIPLMVYVQNADFRNHVRHRISGLF